MSNPNIHLLSFFIPLKQITGNAIIHLDITTSIVTNALSKYNTILKEGFRT